MYTLHMDPAQHEPRPRVCTLKQQYKGTTMYAYQASKKRKLKTKQKVFIR